MQLSHAVRQKLQSASESMKALRKASFDEEIVLGGEHSGLAVIFKDSVSPESAKEVLSSHNVEASSPRQHRGLGTYCLLKAARAENLVNLLADENVKEAMEVAALSLPVQGAGRW